MAKKTNPRRRPATQADVERAKRQAVPDAIHHLRGMNMEMELCGKCAAMMKTAFTLTKIKTGVDMKVTCQNCKKRRFGALYAVSKKEK